MYRKKGRQSKRKGEKIKRERNGRVRRRAHKVENNQGR
jgi:hypothetical protein